MNSISSVMAKYTRNAAARANDLSISPPGGVSPHISRSHTLAILTLATVQLANSTPDFSSQDAPSCRVAFREFLLTLDLTSGFIFYIWQGQFTSVRPRSSPALAWTR